MTSTAVPLGVDPGEVRSFLASLPGVAAITDLHLCAISITDIALSAELAIREGVHADAVLARATDEVCRRFPIDCVTLRAESHVMPASRGIGDAE